MLVKLSAAALHGVDALAVSVEVRVGRGIHFTMGGLPNSAVRESHTRVRSAIEVAGYHWPGRGITVNLAPADVRKEGTAYDLPLALGILAASGQLAAELLEEILFVGELALDGGLRPVRGAVVMASLARTMVLPTESAAEAALAKGVTVYGADSLSAVIAHLNGSVRIKPTPCGMDELLTGAINEIAEATLGAVRGQEAALRGLELAMAGGHNMLLVGPPGAGKTMIAKSAPALIPPLTAAEQIQVSRIHSVRKKSTGQHKFGRPFRAVHHSTTQTTLLGGGADPRPGEISLAHGGVLFLDELGEWDRHVLNALRDPLESGRITISRAQVSVDFPCEFQLIAATNPCPCGYLGHVSRSCDCSEHRITAYRRRFSGPLLDRIDIQLDIHPVNLRALDPRMFTGDKVGVRKARVLRARAIQSKRNPGGRTNSRLNPAEVLRIVKISNALRLFLIETMNSYHLSARSHDRVLKMARTLADLDGRKNVNKRDLAEALQYRRAGH